MTSDNINGYQSKNFFFFEIFPAQYVSLFMVVLTDSCYRVIADFDATLTMFWVNGTRGQSMLFSQRFISPFEALMQKKNGKTVIRN